MFLVTVHDPICTPDGSLEAALYGSFFPVPDASLFPLAEPDAYLRANAPGALVLRPEPIVINPGRKRVRLRVTNHGDRPVQVGSHYPFIEVNPSLSFDRGRAYGMRLDIAAGTAVRFEPGDSKTVKLVEIAGTHDISGGNSLASGAYDLGRTEAIVSALVQKGFAHAPEPGALELSEDTTVTHEAYVSMFGPTTGDRVRLGDTALWVQVEYDLCAYGEEVKFGGGKTVRDGMAQASGCVSVAPLTTPPPLDLVITNALIIDWSGIYKVRAAAQSAGHPHLFAYPRTHTGGRRRSERAHLRDWQVGQPFHDGGRGLRARRRLGDGGDRGREAHPHRRRGRRARALHLPATGHRGARGGDDDDDRRRDGPECGHERDDVHEQPVLHAAHARGDGRAPDELCVHGQGERLARARA